MDRLGGQVRGGGHLCGCCVTFCLDSVPCVPVALEELLSLLGSGLVGVGEEELEEALGRARAGEGSEGGSGRESRVALYEFSDPLVCLGG